MARVRRGIAGSFFELRPNVRDRVGGAPAAEREAPAPRRPRRKKPRRRRGPVGTLVYWGAVLGVWVGLAVGALAVWQAARLPPLHTLVVPKRPPTVTILGVDGKMIATRGDMGGIALPLKALPPYLPQAFIAIEDRRFYRHFGLDPVGIVRAVYVNVTSRGVREGASTLTQQLAKNLFLSEQRTFARKLDELVLALWLERTYSKDQILELYLNRVYFGSGAYGVEAAAQRYFGKSARAVTLAEATMLAGLVKAPSRLAPTRNPVLARERAELVLTAMVDGNFVSEGMARTARLRPAAVVQNSGPGSIGYVADWVMDSLDDYVGPLDSDVTVQTTIDPVLQMAAEKSLAEELAPRGERFGVTQGAIVAMDPNGAVRARSRAEERRRHPAAHGHRIQARRQRLDRARHLGGEPARARFRLCAVRQRRHRRHLARDRAGARHEWEISLRPRRLRPWPRRGTRARGDDEPHAGGDAAHRHGAPRRAARLAGGGQDRHQPGFPRCLVRRLRRPPGRRCVARHRRQLAEQARGRLEHAGGHLEQVYAHRARGRAHGGAARRQLCVGVAAGDPARGAHRREARGATRPVRPGPPRQLAHRQAVRPPLSFGGPKRCSSLPWKRSHASARFRSGVRRSTARQKRDE